MKHLPHTLALTAIAYSLASCAAPNATPPVADMGPHGKRAFQIVRMKHGELASDMQDHAMALLLEVSSKMEGGKQVITANASAHLDGPDGRTEPVDNIGVHLIQPLDFKTPPPKDKKTAGATTTQSVAAPDGKYKTVVAEAMMSSSKFPDVKVNVTVPGDK